MSSSSSRSRVVESKPSPMITVGIDIGSESTKVVLGPAASCEIVRSSVGGHTTPTAVSFSTTATTTSSSNSSSSSRRFIGADANLKSHQVLIHLNRLLPGLNNGNKEDPFRPFYRFQVDDAQNQVTFLPQQATDEDKTTATTATTTFATAAVIAMLLGKLRQSVQETLNRMQLLLTSSSTLTRIEYVLTLPPSTPVEAHCILQDAAYAAGLCGDSTLSKIHSTASCLAAAYQRKFPVPPSTTNIVVMVDMGHAQTTVTVLLRLCAKKDGNDNETTDDDDNNNNKTAKIQILSSVSHPSLGAGSVDMRLWHHFCNTLPQLQNAAAALQPSSRQGQRLLEACRKLKHILSQLTTGSVTVENIHNDQDVVISCTRHALTELCHEETKALQQLLQQALDEGAAAAAAESDSNNEGPNQLAVDTVEVLGGGCRIPLFQEVIRETLGVSQLSHTLDDTSVALGAAVLGSEQSPFVVNPESDKEELQQLESNNSREKESLFRQQLRSAEEQMAKVDKEMAARGEIRNKIEAHVLEMRAVQQQTDNKHSALLPDASLLNAHLDDVDDWLFSAQADEASLSEMQAKLDAVEDKTNVMCREYLQAVKNEQEAKEKEMEEEAQRAKAERDAAGSDEDEDDHDTRRLPKKRRMEIVMKNKAEANELFSHGNYRHAAARYTKALTHCAKFVDLSPEDLEEVKGVKLSLNLNLALSYFKLEKYDQALRVSNEALELDGDSAKALYRRATVYFEKKRWEDARCDLDRAAKNAPQDKAIQKLQAKVDLQMKKQKAKEKKMAQKMFG